MNILVHFSRALAPGRPYRGRLYARPETGLERLRRSRVIPLLALAVLLGPLVPRTARADGPPPPSPPTGLSIQGGQASLGAAESSPSAASSLAVASVDPSTGVLHTSIAFDLPKARGGVQPQLALTYSSSAPFGVGGRGWSLGIPSVERHNPSGPPQFNDPAPGQAVNPAAQDRFTFGGQPLVEVCFIASGGTCTYGGSNETLKGQNLLLPGEQLPSFATPGGWHYYRFQTETGALTRFFWSADHMTWVVQDKSGTISEYGWSQDHTTAATDNDGYGHIFRWNVVKRYDAERISGSAPANLISYVWTAMTPTLGGTLGYLTDIYDTPRVGDAAPATDSFAHHTHLAYTATPWATGPIWNPSVTAPVWFALPTFVLTRVDVASQDYAATGARQQVRRYHLTYNSAASDSIESPPTISSVQLEGDCAGAGGPSETFPNNFETNGQLPAPSASNGCPTRPATTFTYAPTLPYEPKAVAMPSMSGTAPSPTIFDVNNDGQPDFLDVAATPPVVWINSALAANTFVQQPLALGASNVLNLANINQLTPSPSYATGSFQLDGRLDMLWADIAGASSGGTYIDPTTGLLYFSDSSVQYALVNISQSNGTWTLTPSLNGTFSLRSAFPDWFSPVVGEDCNQNAMYPLPISAEGIPIVEGSETPIAPVDIDGDGIADSLNIVAYTEQTQDPNDYDCVSQSNWVQYAVRFSKRAFDDSYWPFYGTSASAPIAGARTDVCVGGLTGAQQNALSPLNTFADVDGDGIVDFVQFGSTSYGYTVPTWWPGHGDGVFGMCPNGIQGVGSNEGAPVQCACGSAQGVPLLVPLPNSAVYAIHDVNGDGLGDIIVSSPGGFSFYENAGVLLGNTPQFLEPITVPANALLGWSGQAAPTAFYFADMDASGADDIIVQEVPAGGSAATAFGFVDVLAGTDGPASLRPGLLTGINNGLGLTTQVTYDTTADLARKAATSSVPWNTHSPQSIHVVTSLTTSDTTSDSYTTKYAYWNPVFDGRDNQFLGFQRVRQTTPGDNDTLMNTDTTYFYGACGADWGVTCATGIDYPLASYRGLPTLVEVFNGVTSGTGDFTSDTYLSSVHHSYATNQLFWGTDDRRVRRIYEAQTDSFLYDTSPFQASLESLAINDTDLSGYGGSVRLRGKSPHHLQKKMTLDAFGNLASVVDNGDLGDTSGTAADPSITSSTTWFVPPTDDPGNNWTWRAHVVTTGASASDPMSRTSTYAYDAYGNLTDVTRTLVGTAPLARTPSISAPSPTGASLDGAAHVTHITYDPGGTGQPISEQDFPSSTGNNPSSRCTEFTYDPAYSALLTTEKLDVGGCESAQSIATTHNIDRVLEVETSTISPGGARSAMTYDWFGRLLTVAKPDPVTAGVTDAPTTSITYTDTSYGQLVHTNLAAGAGYAAKDIYAYKDAFGRTIETASTADAAGQWIVSGQVIRDQRGRTTVAFVPYFATGSGSNLYSPNPPTVLATGTSYDAFSRVTQTTDIDGTVTSTSKFHALSVESRDGEQAKAAGPHVAAYVLTTRDGHGRTVQVDDYGNGGDITTISTYQATGEVTAITRSGTDNSGVAVSYVRTMQYDTLGRLVVNREPNTAPPTSNVRQEANPSWIYAYDDLGDLVGTSDARGCGKNIAYDGAGRLLSEDYSPCSTTLQNPWTAPQPNGDGTEAYYVYEGAALQTGRVSDVYDRASHVHLTHDARGRLTQVDREIAQPGIPTAALSTRYSATDFTTATGYDDRDRAISETTGANVAELMSATEWPIYGPSSTVTGTYSPRGILASVTSSYGPIVTATVAEADGRVNSVTYGDPAKTTIAYSYGDSRRRLTETKISREGSFPSATGTYTPPAAGAAEPTQQTVLADDLIPASNGYDAVNNPLQINDGRLVGEWPAGAAPVTTRAYVYDDSYRATNVTSTYPAGVNVYQAPVAPTTDTTSPFPLATGGNRVLNQTFAYDGLGNTLSSTDNAQTFFDRSLGTISNGGSAAGPNQLVSAALASSSTGSSGALTATYDSAGNMVQLALERHGPCTSSTGCNQLFQYDWDEVGRLARARRFDFVGGETCINEKELHLCTLNPEPYNFAYPTFPAANPNADVSYAYDASGTRVLRASTPFGEETSYSAENLSVATSRQRAVGRRVVDVRADKRHRGRLPDLRRLCLRPRRLQHPGSGDLRAAARVPRAHGFARVHRGRCRQGHERAGREDDLPPVRRPRVRLPARPLAGLSRRLQVHGEGGRRRGRAYLLRRPVLLAAAGEMDQP